MKEKTMAKRKGGKGKKSTRKGSTSTGMKGQDEDRGMQEIR